MTQTQDPKKDLLAKEIRNLRGALLAELRKRVDHPTYGVTKTSLRADLARLEGALAVYALFYCDSLHLHVWVDAARELEIDLQDLARQIKEA